MLKYLIEKEFKQIARNSFIPRLLVMFPLMIILVLPWFATLDIKDVNVTVVDKDCSTLSARLTNEIDASDYFSLHRVTNSYAEAMSDVEYGDADLILEIPRDFARNSGSGKTSELLISANAVNGTKGSLGGSYMASIVNTFANKILEENGTQTQMPIKLSVQNKFNPTQNYRHFMIPAFIALLIIMLCGFLPALNIVGEKETGTIEQINVTPVGKFQFIFAKLIPYWAIGFVVMTGCFLLSWAAYGLLPAGNFVVIYSGAFLFILIMSSFGLIISNYSQTMQQSILVMFFFVLIFNLMSGLFSPVRSMPEWAQWLAVFIPPRYFIDVMRGVYQRGCGFSDLWLQFAAMGVFAIILALIAILGYRKRA